MSSFIFPGSFHLLRSRDRLNNFPVGLSFKENDWSSGDTVDTVQTRGRGEVGGTKNSHDQVCWFVVNYTEIKKINPRYSKTCDEKTERATDR